MEATPLRTYIDTKFQPCSNDNGCVTPSVNRYRPSLPIMLPVTSLVLFKK